MDRLVIHKNKGEVVNCHLKVDGASTQDTQVRLCLEFSDNKNLFFYGTLEKDGNCSIKIPKLSDVGNKEGKLVIEAVIDSTYFKLYEAVAELKNSVDIEFSKPKISKEATTNIVIENLRTEKPTPPETPKYKSESKNPYIPQDPVVPQEVESQKDKFKKFQDFIKKK